MPYFASLSIRLTVGAGQGLARLLALWAMLTTVAFAAEMPVPEPLEIDAPGKLVFGADPRFTPADRGTIEISFAINPTQPDAPDKPDPTRLCIVEHGDGDGAINWRLSITSDKKFLMFQRRQGSVIITPVKVGESGYVHLGIVNSGGFTRIITGEPESEKLDEGGMPDQLAAMTPMAATAAGLPLKFGCSKGPTARVWVSSFRIWDGALTADDLRYTRDFLGKVSGRPDLEKQLLMYSVFTEKSKSLRFTGEKIQFTPFKGVEGGEEFFFRRPLDKELAGILAWGAFGNGRLADLRVEYDGLTRRFQVNTDKDPNALSLPTIMPQTSSNISEVEADFLLSKLRALHRTSPGQTVSIETLHEQFIRMRRAARGAAFGVKTTDPNGMLFEMLSDGNQPEALFAKRVYAALVDGDRIIRLNGMANNEGIVGWAIETTGPRLYAPTTGPITSDMLIESFSLAIPEGAQFEGIAGKRDGGGLKSLAFAYSMPRQPDEDLLKQVSAGVWIDRDRPEPLPDDKTFRLPDGTYEDQVVYRLIYNAARKRLIVAVSGKYAQNRQVLFQTYKQAKNNEWFVENLPDRRLVMFENGIRLYGKDDTPFTRGRTLVRPTPYEPPSRDQLPWGATFSMDHRPNGIEANFNGYMPFKMFTRNLQKTTGALGQLFDMPDAASRNYYATGSRVIVPYGLHYKIESAGSERSDMTKIDTETQRQTSWMLGLGIHVGIPLIASFDADGSHQESQETVDKTEFSHLEDRATVTHYALVLDPSRMKLSAEFRARIAALRARYATRQPIDWKGFFEYFGTHYPHAVTYGGMAWADTTVRSTFSMTQTSSTDKQSVSTKFPLDEMLEIGLKANHESSEGAKDAGGLSLSNSNYGTYGGNYSRGGGWSVQRGEELPVLLDLRPMDELLSPAFFDDAMVYMDLRFAMHEALADFNFNLALRVKATRPWARDIDPKQMVLFKP